jgi:predicted Rossmann fold nucleotide-binding protein DprA/Smf involved in DNA uptake|tara:strand:+ start:3191 stop:3592 length:402 start_codon:yes stop_codon:yes gene_type:complete
MKVGIVGSRRYENKKKIKDFIFKLKQEYGENTTIVSGGAKDGADKYAKKYALELGLQYEEYPPAHHTHNLYCTLPESRYGKQYSPKNYHVRNKIIAGTSDVIAAFVPRGEQSSGTMSTINYAKKFEKKYIIIN